MTSPDCCFRPLRLVSLRSPCVRIDQRNGSGDQTGRRSRRSSPGPFRRRAVRPEPRDRTAASQPTSFSSSLLLRVMSGGRTPVRLSAVIARMVGPGRYRAAIERLRSGGCSNSGSSDQLEVVGPEGPLALGGRKQRATLAILLLDANRVVSMDRLADELYAGRAPSRRPPRCIAEISELRKALGEDAKLETRSPGYVIRVAPGRSTCSGSND